MKQKRSSQWIVLFVALVGAILTLALRLGELPAPGQVPARARPAAARPSPLKTPVVQDRSRRAITASPSVGRAKQDPAASPSPSVEQVKQDPAASPSPLPAEAAEPSKSGDTSGLQPTVVPTVLSLEEEEAREMAPQETESFDLEKLQISIEPSSGLVTDTFRVRVEACCQPGLLASVEYLGLAFTDLQQPERLIGFLQVPNENAEPDSVEFQFVPRTANLNAGSFRIEQARLGLTGGRRRHLLRPSIEASEPILTLHTAPSDFRITGFSLTTDKALPDGNEPQALIRTEGSEAKSGRTMLELVPQVLPTPIQMEMEISLPDGSFPLVSSLLTEPSVAGPWDITLLSVTDSAGRIATWSGPSLKLESVAKAKSPLHPIRSIWFEPAVAAAGEAVKLFVEFEQGYPPLERPQVSLQIQLTAAEKREVVLRPSGQSDRVVAEIALPSAIQPGIISIVQVDVANLTELQSYTPATHPELFRNANLEVR